jgi:hypothetical protein
MLAMVSYHRPKSGHITCYLNRTYHVLLTRVPAAIDGIAFSIDHSGPPSRAECNEFFPLTGL